jgi:asparagine synthase (glutamine-hydrolysing)
MLSGGYDSRLVLALHPSIDDCYTVGSEQAAEVRVARQVADQYGSTHTRLPPGERYLVPTDREIEFSQGLRETLHIHQSGHESTMNADEMFHGMLFDTLFRNYSIPHASIDVAGMSVPLPWLDRDPELGPILEDSLDCVTPGVDLVSQCDAVAADSYREFLGDTLDDELSRCYERCDGIHNACAQLGIRTRPTMPFRMHLTNHFLERYVAADTELVAWHLQTPPEYRTTRTFLKALRRLDTELLAHRPPNRPHDSPHANEIEGFVRRTMPFLEGFESPWPDRHRLYDRYDLDERLLPDVPELHDAPVQFKLRLNDARSWLDRALERDAATDAELRGVLPA